MHVLEIVLLNSPGCPGSQNTHLGLLSAGLQAYITMPNLNIVLVPSLISSLYLIQLHHPGSPHLSSYIDEGIVEIGQFSKVT